MALARANFAIQDEDGNIINGASIEVRRESDNTLVSVYSDVNGTVPLGNPYVAASGENAGFYAETETYKITATHASIGTLTWRYQTVLNLDGLEVDLSSPGPIGGTTPSTGAFTELTISSGGTITFGSSDAIFTHVSGGKVKLSSSASGVNAGFELICTDAGAASGPWLTLYRDSASPAISDVFGAIGWAGRTSTAARVFYGNIYMIATNVTNGAHAATMIFGVSTAGAVTDELGLNAAQLYPVTDAGLTLGIADTNEFGQLYLTSGGAVRWDNSQALIQGFAGSMTFAAGTAAQFIFTTGTMTFSTVAAGDVAAFRISSSVAGVHAGIGWQDNGATKWYITKNTSNQLEFYDFAGSKPHLLFTTGTVLTGRALFYQPFGYQTGAGVGGTVTQATSKSTGVTLNAATGAITLHNESLTTGQSRTFTMTNSTIAATDTVSLSIKSGATANTYHVDVRAVTAGACDIQIHNYSAGTVAEAVVINFNVIKGAAT